MKVLKYDNCTYRFHMDQKSKHSLYCVMGGLLILLGGYMGINAFYNYMTISLYQDYPVTYLFGSLVLPIVFCYLGYRLVKNHKSVFMKG